MQPMLNIALRAARLASEQVQRAQDKVEIVRSEKDEINELIEETVNSAEKTIAYTIQKAYPKHALQGQFSGDYPSTTDKTEATWYISAIDNIANFSKGIPQTAICLAVLINGKVEHTVVINPVTGEEYTASRGHGAILNGRRIRVTDNKGLESATISTTFADTTGDKSLLESHLNMCTKLHSNRGLLQNTGSAALNFANVAAGRIDGSYADNLQLATTLASALLIQEAGGLAGDLSGGANFKKTKSLVAGNAKVFKSLVQAIHA